jgi:hypothetical protein
MSITIRSFSHLIPLLEEMIDRLPRGHQLICDGKVDHHRVRNTVAQLAGHLIDEQYGIHPSDTMVSFLTNLGYIVQDRSEDELESFLVEIDDFYTELSVAFELETMSLDKELKDKLFHWNVIDDNIVITIVGDKYNYLINQMEWKVRVLQKQLDRYKGVCRLPVNVSTADEVDDNILHDIEEYLTNTIGVLINETANDLVKEQVKDAIVRFTNRQ